MAQVRCENVTEGLRASEALASVRDYHGRQHFIRVERDFLSEQNHWFYLPIGVVHVDPKTKAVRIASPGRHSTGVLYASRQTRPPMRGLNQREGYASESKMDDASLPIIGDL